MAGRIVVGTDGSESSKRALDWAVAEAGAREAVLQPVIVWQSPYDYGELRYVPVDEEQLAEGARKRLEQEIAEAAGEASPATTVPLVAHGDPAQVLCERSASADLLVVGSRGHGGFAGLMLGSVSTKCAHHSRCPLVIVRGTADRDYRLVRRILVGVDGSEGSRRALAWAVDEAALHGASVEALDVWRDPYGADMSLEFDMEHFRVDRELLLERAQDRLAAAVAEAVAAHPGAEVAPVLLQGEDTTRVLCERSADADLLVVGARGHGGFLRLLPGSASIACAHHSKCPVVIIPNAG
ncbi:MAG TPA: universal stress protein [Trebonia sp.]|nr:universal stress protein [Trebonia sp.]